MDENLVINFVDSPVEDEERSLLCRLTVPPPLPSARQQQLLRWKLAKASFDDIQDLQLAAELGRTLLERNEELETELKQQQIVIDDQGQEIEFLTKQVSSMKEESASRAKIYEQLESSICELERTNSQLGRKHEVDKKRIQSLCENIEYLERKCEELNVTLQSLQNDQGKKSGSQGKVNRSSYFSFGSDSSEEEMSSGFGLGGGFRRRSHSLQDLRDYTPSPDEFDSGNSNSPDLKTSESEFIDSLENRIEELVSSKRKQTDKVRQLETQIKLLIQENANLQQQIVQISNDKDEEISELRRHLQDSSNYNSQLNSSFTVPLSSTRRNSDANSTHNNTNNISGGTSFHAIPDSSSMPFSSTSIGLGSSISSSSISRISPPTVCKRCSAEINVLNLVNSIEHDNNDVNCYEWEFGSPEDDMEFSSLEHELARATGTTYRIASKDNRLSSSCGSPVNHNNNRIVISPTRSNSLNNPNSASLPSPKKLARSRKLKDFLRTNPSQIDIEEMDYENSELFDIFFGHDDKDETGEDVLSERSPLKVRFSKEIHTDGEMSSSSTEDETGSDERLDEDPCLIKDRKPEFAKSKLGKSKSKKLRGGVSSSTFESPSATFDELELKSNGCAATATTSSINNETFTKEQLSHVNKVVKSSSSLKHSSNPKFLELPARIPSDDEVDSRDNRVSSAERNGVPKSSKDQSDLVSKDQKDHLQPEEAKPKGSSLPYQKQESSSSGYESEYSSTSTCIPGSRNRKTGDGGSSSSEGSSSDYEMSSGALSSSASTVSFSECAYMSSSSESSYEDIEHSFHLDDPSSSLSLSSAQWTSSIMPEYKQILQNLFNIFNNSKRKYPIPMYPFIQEARRQSTGLIYHNNNNNNDCNNTKN